MTRAARRPQKHTQNLPEDSPVRGSSHELRDKLDRILAQLQNAGTGNAVGDLEQVAQLLYLKLLDTREPPSSSRLFPGQTARFRWSKLRRLRGEELHAFLHGEVLPYMASLDREDPAVAEYYRDATLKITAPHALERIVDEIDCIDFERLRPDEMGEILEYLLSRVGRGGPSAEFRTSPHLRRLMVTLVDPKPYERIFDPACGTGGLLTDAVEYMLARASSEPRETPIYGEAWLDEHGLTLETAKERYPSLQTVLREQGELNLNRTSLGEHIFGYDVSRMMIRIAQMNLALQQIGNVNIKRTNTISKIGGPNPEDIDRLHDVVLCDPPFGDKPTGDSRRSDLHTASSRKELLFLEVAMRALAPKGRCVLLLPNAMLFSATKALLELRRQLVDEYQVHAVISLPAEIMKQYSGIQLSLLVFSRPLIKGNTSESVWFYQLRNDGFRWNSFSNEMRIPAPASNDIPELLAQWNRYRLSGFKSSAGLEASSIVDPEQPAPQSWWASVKQIVENDYDLSAERYRPQRTHLMAVADPTESIQEVINIHKALVVRLEEFKKAIAHSNAFRHPWVGHVTTKKLGDLVEIVNGSTPARGTPSHWTGSIPWVSLKDMPEDLKWTLLTQTENHVSESANPTMVSAPAILMPVRSAMMASTIPMAISAKPLAISESIRALIPYADSGIDVWYLFAALKASEDALLTRTQGTTLGIRWLRDKDLKNLDVPFPQKEVREQIAQAIRDWMELSSVAEKANKDVSGLWTALLGATFASRKH